MTRDNTDRVSMFAGAGVEVERIALNMDQIEEYEPPPNPAKFTDSRVWNYVDKYGYESWELDALRPQVISDLIEDKVLEYRDPNKWVEILAKEEEEKAQLRKLSDRWDDVLTFLNKE